VERSAPLLDRRARWKILSFESKNIISIQLLIIDVRFINFIHRYRIQFES